MRIQFPAGYREGQSVETADGQVTLDADLRADLTERAYWELQKLEPGLRFAPQSFSRGKPIGNLGRQAAAAQRDAMRQASALLAGKADVPTKGEILARGPAS